MLVKRLDKNITLIYYKPITRKQYVRNIHFFHDTQSFNIDVDIDKTPLHKDINKLRCLIYDTDLQERLNNNNAYKLIVEV